MNTAASDKISAWIARQSTGLSAGARPFWLPAGPVGILIIHGYGGSIGDYRELAHDLRARGYSILGLTVAGHGRGPTTLAGTDSADWRASVFAAARLLKQRCRQIVLLGFSFGGSLAIDYAIHAPAQLLAVVTVNTPVRYRGAVWFRRLGLRWLRLFTPYYHKPNLTTEDRRRMREIGSLDRWPIGGLLETEWFIATFVWPALPRLRVPTLIVSTKGDPYVATQSATVLSERMTNSPHQLVVLSASTHRPVRDPGLRAELGRRIDQFVGPLLVKDR
ncbi:MAG: alpha/beta fold hydrolase [Candidatus Kerfeldbacteria bacterium]|nr:alpha/beta fold hydrolase [Candidatus Kerfeldbacteria bacterium]